MFPPPVDFTPILHQMAAAGVLAGLVSLVVLRCLRASFRHRGEWNVAAVVALVLAIVSPVFGLITGVYVAHTLRLEAAFIEAAILAVPLLLEGLWVWFVYSQRVRPGQR